MAPVIVYEHGGDGPQMRALAQALQKRGFSVRLEASVGGNGLPMTPGAVCVASAKAQLQPAAGDAKPSAPLVRVAFATADVVEDSVDLSPWRGGAREPALSPLVAALASALPSGARKGQWRERRVQVIAGLAMLVLAGSLGAGLFFFSRPSPPSVDEAARIAMERLRSGALSGGEAITVAGRIADAAFQDTNSPSMAVAKSVFAEAAVELVQDPNPAVRSAIERAGAPDPGREATGAMIALANTGTSAAPALYRAVGALMTAQDDPRASQALGLALRRNPQHSEVWRLLSEAQRRAGAAKAADTSALIAKGLGLAGANDRTGADAVFAAALEAAEDPRARAFLLGQRGDYAAQKGDFRGASGHYAEAIALHLGLDDLAALSIDSSKLARAWVTLGRREAACAVLTRAKAAGATLTPAEQAAACGP